MPNIIRFHQPVRFLFVLAMFSLLTGCCSLRQGGPRPDPTQAVFPTPELARQALVQAVKAGDTNALLRIFGEPGREIMFSGDAADDEARRKVVAGAMAEKASLTPEDDRQYLVIGKDNWHFPVPLVDGKTGWFFDTAAGKEELLTRRLGRNELNAIQVCRAFVLAQHEYAAEDRDGDKILEFAQSLRSAPGQTNGLFWVSGKGETQGFIGPLLAAAAVEKANLQPPTPYHGYYYKILLAQGKAAPDGRKNYMDKDNLTGGFALIAYPARYGVTGIMTFMVSDLGIVYEKNLGRKTAEAVQSIAEYNPDKTWHPVME